MTRVSTFTDDALGALDAVGVAANIAAGAIHPAEAVAAAIGRAARASELNAIVLQDDERAFRTAHQPLTGPFTGVPTYIKDNVLVRGWPTAFGSRAVHPHVAKADDNVVAQLRATGMVFLGKSTMSEFGFTPTVEYDYAPPTRNPWNTDYSTGGSSGGSAALVAAGVVPVAHAKDGGGSIRIPAAACGLVGLKFTRHREAPDIETKRLPIDLNSNGIVSRSVRDTAVFAHAIDSAHNNRKLPRIGEVTGPGRRLRIAVVDSSPNSAPLDDETRAALERTAALLADLGHDVERIESPVGPEFAEAFVHYWAMLAYGITRAGRVTLGKGFDASATGNIAQGLATMFRANMRKTPSALKLLRSGPAMYRREFADRDLILTPTVNHTTPPLGFLDPTMDFDEGFARVIAYDGFCPLNNVTGGPAISLPLATTDGRLPIGLMFSADIGNERALLEVAFELEQAVGFPTLAS